MLYASTVKVIDPIMLTAATGGAWLMFGLFSILWSRLSVWQCADTCLLAMVLGECALVIAAVINLALPQQLLAFNWIAIFFSDVLMGLMMAIRFASFGFAPWKTWLLWLLVLNGVATAVATAWLIR